MFTPIKRALTALIITTSLLTPISANAKYLGHEQSVEIIIRGEIISNPGSGTSFLINYKSRLFYCLVSTLSPQINAYCYDDQPE